MVARLATNPSIAPITSIIISVLMVDSPVVVVAVIKNAVILFHLSLFLLIIHKSHRLTHACCSASPRSHTLP